MATNSSSRLIVSFRKRVVDQIRVRSADSTHLSTLRRAAHTSVYDKNPDEHVRPSFAPDDVITPEPDKYWAPNPNTGVFGPDATSAPGAGGEAAAANGDKASVLEEKAWYRPTHIEDLEKPNML